MPEKQNDPSIAPEDIPCAKCDFRRKAEAKPGSFLSRLWRWYTGWCPGWKAYQKALAAQK